MDTLAVIGFQLAEKTPATSEFTGKLLLGETELFTVIKVGAGAGRTAEQVMSDMPMRFAGESSLGAISRKKKREESREEGSPEGGPFA